jgi:triphosphatase
MTTEFELKFQVDPRRRAAVEAALHGQAAARMRMQAHYYDTAERLLSRHGIALRLRNEGRAWVQTLKAPGEDAVQRLEDNVPVPGRWGEAGPDLDPRRHDGTPAGAALNDVLRDAGEVRLERVVSSDVWRRSAEIHAGDGSFEIAFDEGQVVAGNAAEPICEVEYELKQGSAAAMIAVARQGVLEHGLWWSTLSKAQRGERLADPTQPIIAQHAATPLLDRDMSGGALLRAVVRSCIDQVLANASEVAAGSRQEEHIHQLRVGIRRLRTALRELSDLSPQVDAGWEAPLTAVFRKLGEFRDRDTVLRTVQPALEAAGAPSVALEDASSTIDISEVVRAADFQTVMLDLFVFALDSPGEGDVDAPAVHKQIRRRLKKLHDQVMTDGRRFESLDEAAQHRVRKRLKRLRYLAELVAPLFDGRAVERYLDRLRPAQDALGAHNDIAVAAEVYRAAADSGQAHAWFAVGWLAARRSETDKECRKALAKTAKAPGFWH